MFVRPEVSKSCNHSGSMLIVEEYEELVNSGLVDPFPVESNTVIVCKLKLLRTIYDL